jgi:pheromone shutdown protein TraB
MIHVLGIRHHGPGSAKNVKAFLEELKPDMVLVEGPPEADSILQWADDAALKPPVAILVYQPDDPKESAFYPFAEFSPEWQAIQYARQHKVPVRFMDLPIAHQIAITAKEKEAQKAQENEENRETENTVSPQPEEVPLPAPQIRDEIISASEKSETAPPDFSVLPHHPDPISYLASADGYTDSEKWWEQMFEHRLNNEQVFDAVSEAMTALREVLPRKDEKIEELREAWMRKTIRLA